MNRGAIVLLFLVLAEAGCSRCGQRKPATVAEALPADAELVLLVPDVVAAAGGLDALLQKVTHGAAEPLLGQAKFVIEKMLGFSPLDAEAWRKLGVAPERGLGICWRPEGPAAAVALAQPDVFRRQLKALLEGRTGAVEKPETVDRVPIVTWSLPAGKVLLGLAESGGFAWLAWGGNAPELLARLAHLGAGERLAQAEWYKEMAPQAGELILLVRPGAAARLLGLAQTEPAPLAERGGSLGLRLGAQGLALELFFALSAEEAGRLAKLGEGLADAGLERRLPPDTLLALKARVRPERLLEELFDSRPGSRESYRKTVEIAARHLGEDFEDALVKNLTGQFALAAGTEEPQRLGQLLDAPFPVPAQLVSAAFWLLVWAEVKDPARVESFLERVLERTGERFPGRREEAGPVKALAFSTEQGYRVWLLRSGNLLGICLGANCLERARRALVGEGGSLATAVGGETNAELAQPRLFSGLLRAGLLFDRLGPREFFGAGGEPAEKWLWEVLRALAGNLAEVSFAVSPARGGLWLGWRVRLR